MKILYISGPFSPKANDPDPSHSIDQNILTASRYALLAARKGWAPFTPHKNTAGFQHCKEIEYEFWMACCLEFVKRSDALLMIPGWERSEGANREKDLARALKMPIYHYLMDGIPPADSVVVP